jgi:asparagine synthase (glutamine-hydrolysing)
MPYWLKGKNTIKNLSCRPDEAAVRKHYNLLFNKDLKDMLYAEPGEMNFDFDGWARDFYIRTTAKDPLDKGLYLDIKTYLTDDILVKVDRMSMANSLEVRSPLLDHKVLEFLATIPSSLKLKGRTTKYILKELLAKELPEEIISRKKTGFRLPIEVWLKKDLKNLVNDVIFSQEFKNRGYFNTDFIQQMWGDFNKGKKDYAHHIWQLFMLELWHREYADKGGPPQFGGGI